jgi:hypothetical protein
MSADAADSKAAAHLRSKALTTWTARLKPALGAVLLDDLIRLISGYLLTGKGGTRSVSSLIPNTKTPVLIGSFVRDRSRVEPGPPLQTLRHRRRRCGRIWSVRSFCR